MTLTIIIRIARLLGFAIVLIGAANKPVRADDNLRLSQVVFVTSPKWYVFEPTAKYGGQTTKNGSVLMFKKYAFSVINTKIAGVEKIKNILDFGCQRDDTHWNFIKLYLPDWINYSFDRSIPNPHFPARISIDKDAINFSVDGDYNSDSLFIDFNKLYSDNLRRLLDAYNIQISLGGADKFEIEQRTNDEKENQLALELVDDAVKIVASSWGNLRFISLDTRSMLYACLEYKKHGRLPHFR